MIKLEGNVLHVGELMINIPMSLKYKDLSENEWKLFFECVLEQQDQLAKANERVAELEREVLGVKNFLKRYRYRIKGGEPMQKQIDDVLQGENGYLETVLNKFAIEQKIEAINEALDYYEELKASEGPIGAGNILHVCLGRLVSQQEQLRKEQGSE